MVTATARLRHVVREEVGELQPRLHVASAIARALPDLVGNRVRTAAFRAAGVSIGDGTVIGGSLTIAGNGRCHERLTIGSNAWINAGCYLDASDRITIRDGVALGQRVLLLTQTHEIGPRGRHAGALRTAPIDIGEGAWIGAGAVILPGVTIGGGSVIGAASVVTRATFRPT